MELIPLIAIGAAVFLLFAFGSKKTPADDNKDTDVDFNVDDEDGTKPSFVCLIKKWEDLKDCAEKLHLDEAVKQLDNMWPSLNKKELF